MNDSLLQKDIMKAMGIDALSPDDQVAFIAEVGDVVLETALVRFASILNEPQHIALQQYLETEPEPEALMSHLLEHYEEFKDILEAVVVEIKEDTEKTFGAKK